MRYVPSLPPIVEPVPDNGAVKATARVAATAPVAERSLPPLVYRPRPAMNPLPAINRRHAPRPTGGIADRRQLCRRTRHLEVLLDLRSGPDRRRHRQRADDITTAIDEEI